MRAKPYAHKGNTGVKKGLLLVQIKRALGKLPKHVSLNKGDKGILLGKLMHIHVEEKSHAWHTRIKV